jgi:hypothetical protein
MLNFNRKEDKEARRQVENGRKKHEKPNEVVVLL